MLAQALSRTGPILIIEDDLDIREVLAETLADRGFGVVTAANGRDAIGVLLSMPDPPSVILVDLMMPIMDGYAFLEECQKDLLLASIPVAIFTAGNGIDRKRLGAARPVIAKPIDLEKLIRVVDHLRSQTAG